MADNTAKKQRGRPFAPGQSGNPRGRPKGARNRVTLLMRDLLDGDAESVVKRAIADAKKGKPIALRLVLERLIPPARSDVATIELPDVAKAADVAEAAREVIAAAARGELTLAEARDWMVLFEGQRKTIESEELAVRLELLEQSERLRTKRRLG